MRSLRSTADLCISSARGSSDLAVARDPAKALACKSHREMTELATRIYPSPQRAAEEMVKVTLDSVLVAEFVSVWAVLAAVLLL
jgi:hypothetical protein